MEPEPSEVQSSSYTTVASVCLELSGMAYKRHKFCQSSQPHPSTLPIALCINAYHCPCTPLTSYVQVKVVNNIDSCCILMQTSGARGICALQNSSFFAIVIVDHQIWLFDSVMQRRIPVIFINYNHPLTWFKVPYFL